MNTATVPFMCPWCGLLHLEIVHAGAETQMICGGGIGDQILHQTERGCKRPIRVVTDNHGNVRLIARIVDAEKSQHSSSSEINIGTVLGSVAFGGDAVTTNIFNETVKMIDETKTATDEQKSEAKNALAYFKKYAPTLLPSVAEIIKKTLGL